MHFKVESARQVPTLFYKKDFQKLEKIAEDFRVNETRTSSGLWELTLYYGGVSQMADRISSSAQWDAVENIIHEWLEKYPESPTAHNVQAILLLERAWSYRGKGWASGVRPEAWEPFENYLGKTRDYLEKHKSIASKDPQWYETMLTVATAQSLPMGDFLSLMEEGTSRYPYFYQIYFTGLNYLTPKWHGSKEKIEAFARAAVAKTKEKEKLGMYARTYWVASQSQYGPRLFTDSDVVWGTMRQGIKDVMEKYPDEWNTNYFAYFACLAHDRSLTAELMSKIEHPIIRYVWRSEPLYHQCREWVSNGVI